MSSSETYASGAFFTGFVVFIGSWLYAIVNYGFFLGIGLGWLPSLIIAFIAGVLWPLVALIVALILAAGIIFVIWVLNH